MSTPRKLRASPQTDILTLPAPSLEMYLIQELRPRPPLISSLLYHPPQPPSSLVLPSHLYSCIITSDTLKHLYIRLRPHLTNFDSIFNSALLSSFVSSRYFAKPVAPSRAPITFCLLPYNTTTLAPTLDRLVVTLQLLRPLRPLFPSLPSFLTQNHPWGKCPARGQNSLDVTPSVKPFTIAVVKRLF